ARSPSGASRARLEEVYALHRPQEGNRRLAEAVPLAAQLQGRSYVRIEAQLMLEKASCLSMIGEHGAAVTEADQALAATKIAGYRIVHLRSLGYNAGLQTNLGNLVAVWSRDRA